MFFLDVLQVLRKPFLIILDSAVISFYKKRNLCWMVLGFWTSGISSWRLVIAFYKNKLLVFFAKHLASWRLDIAFYKNQSSNLPKKICMWICYAMPFYKKMYPIWTFHKPLLLYNGKKSMPPNNEGGVFSYVGQSLGSSLIHPYTLSLFELIVGFERCKLLKV